PRPGRQMGVAPRDHSGGRVGRSSRPPSSQWRTEPIASSPPKIWAGTPRTASSNAVSFHPFGHGNTSPGGWDATGSGRFLNQPNMGAPPNIEPHAQLPLLSPGL